MVANVKRKRLPRTIATIYDLDDEQRRRVYHDFKLWAVRVRYRELHIRQRLPEGYSIIAATYQTRDTGEGLEQASERERDGFIEWYCTQRLAARKALPDE